MRQPSQRETPPNTYKAIRSPYRENTGSVFGGVSRCAFYTQLCDE